MEQLTKNQAVATSQEAVQNQNEPQLRDENAHNDKSVHGVLNPTYQAGLRRDAVQPDIEAERKKRDEIEDRKSGSAGMPRPISYAVLCLKKKKRLTYAAGARQRHQQGALPQQPHHVTHLVIAPHRWPTRPRAIVGMSMQCCHRWELIVQAQ